MFPPMASTVASDPLIILVLGAVALVPIVNGILTIITFFRQDPPAGDYALRKQVDDALAKLEARVNERIAGELGHIRAGQAMMRADIHASLNKMDRDIDELSKTITAAFSDFHRSLGQLKVIVRPLGSIKHSMGSVNGVSPR